MSHIKRRESMHTQVDIRRSVNWVLVGVNYIIRSQKRLLWRGKNCKLAICDDANAIYFASNLIGATTRQYARILNYAPVLPDPIFRQGRRAREKKVCLGTRLVWDSPNNWHLIKTLALRILT